MESDDGGPTIDGEQRRQGRQQGVQLVQLAVDRDPESLEGPGGGVDAAPPTGNGSRHDLGELEGARERTRREDGPGHATRVTLLAPLTQDAGQLVEIDLRMIDFEPLKFSEIPWFEYP